MARHPTLPLLTLFLALPNRIGSDSGMVGEPLSLKQRVS